MPPPVEHAPGRRQNVAKDCNKMAASIIHDLLDEDQEGQAVPALKIMVTAARLEKCIGQEIMTS